MPDAGPGTKIVVDGTHFAEKDGKASYSALRTTVADIRRANRHADVTVVVEACLRYKLNSKDRAAFDTDVAKGQLITPPAGSVGGLNSFLQAIAARCPVTVICPAHARRPVPGAHVRPYSPRPAPDSRPAGTVL